MSDHSTALLRIKHRLRSATTTVVDDVDILREYNAGGTEFAVLSKCIRNIALIKMQDTPTIEKSEITDLTNAFTKVEVSAALNLYRYKLSRALLVETIQVVGKTARNLDGPIRRKSTEEFNKIGGSNPDKQREYPDYWHPYFRDQFELRPWFTKGTDADPFWLLMEYRHRWRDVDAVTNTDNLLPEDWKHAPSEFSIWKNALALREFELASEAQENYFRMLSDAMQVIWEKDASGTYKIAGPLRT